MPSSAGHDDRARSASATMPTRSPRWPARARARGSASTRSRRTCSPRSSPARGRCCSTSRAAASRARRYALTLGRPSSDWPDRPCPGRSPRARPPASRGRADRSAVVANRRLREKSEDFGSFRKRPRPVRQVRLSKSRPLLLFALRARAPIAQRDRVFRTSNEVDKSRAVPARSVVVPGPTRAGSQPGSRCGVPDAKMTSMPAERKQTS